MKWILTVRPHLEVNQLRVLLNRLGFSQDESANPIPLDDEVAVLVEGPEGRIDEVLELPGVLDAYPSTDMGYF